MTTKEEMSFMYRIEEIKQQKALTNTGYDRGVKSPEYWSKSDTINSFLYYVNAISL